MMSSVQCMYVENGEALVYKRTVLAWQQNQLQINFNYNKNFQSVKFSSTYFAITKENKD